MSVSQDPYYLVKEEIQESLTSLEKSYRRLEALPSGIPEFNRLKQEVDEGCESVSWQVDQLQRAIDISVKNPARFNLGSAELESRKKWSANARQQVDDIRHGLQSKVRQSAAVAAPSNASNASNAYERANDTFIANQGDRQMQIIRQQDQELDELSTHVTNIGQIGLAINDELESQGQLLQEFEEDMDATTSRLGAAQRKVAQVLKRAGSTGQLAIIAALTIVLILLIVFTFL